MEQQLARPPFPGHLHRAEVREFFRSSSSAETAGALFAASSQALRTLAAEPRFGPGDLAGFFGVLHLLGRPVCVIIPIHYVISPFWTAPPASGIQPLEVLIT